ncbi:MAG TPA: TadE/TadG family type IV pilus assembly protein [Beijerinckiaceae bacterium]|nr:TadE/TadG family type IV pilus assembly protein [Beijerinckiaceae bacterium]
MRTRALATRFLHDTRGVSFIEFAFIAPVLALVLAGAVDLGGLLYTRYGLDAAVSAGANYAVVKAADVDSSSGAALANTLAAIVSSSGSADWANSTIVVNGGPTVTTSGAGTGSPSTVASGSPGPADSCYCPTPGSSGMNWGSAVACGQTCPNGVFAGKFVYVSANRTYSPFFSSFGFITNWTPSVQAMVQVQ